MKTHKVREILDESNDSLLDSVHQDMKIQYIYSKRSLNSIVTGRTRRMESQLESENYVRMPKLQRNKSKRSVGFHHAEAAAGDHERRPAVIISLKCYLDSKAAKSNSHVNVRSAAAKRNKWSMHNRKQNIPREVSGFSNSSAARFLRSVRVNMARALTHLFANKRPSSSTEVPTDVISSTRFVPPRDSHHSEAMEDCIEFVNSSYRKSL
ncbi:josephin [Apostasia shenzhenica]|uniref:Josephin n=1 Tax=Apostasia shenzhenica TaxID=1088818 RepID=A0A2I0AAD1_9ASPA|nr:josephin [Apostasia shenzhenica]